MGDENGYSVQEYDARPNGQPGGQRRREMLFSRVQKKLTANG